MPTTPQIPALPGCSPLGLSSKAPHDLAQSLADPCAERQRARRERHPSSAEDWRNYATVDEMRAYLTQTKAEADATR